MTARAWVVIGAFAAVGGFVSTATAQERKPVEFMNAVPESPAFTYLGISPSKVQQPGHLRDLGAAILSGIGDDGRARDGFALDASVWNLIPDFDIPLDEYRSNRFKYAIANLQASIATARAAGDSSDLRMAIGVKTVLFDDSDPMLNPLTVTTLGARLQRCAPAQPGGTVNTACTDSAVDEVIRDSTQSRWNASQLAISAALGTRFENAELSRNAPDGLNIWLLGSYGMGSSVQWIGQLGYKQRSEVDTVPAYQALNLGGRLVFGRPTYNAFVEYGREWRSLDDSGPDLVLDKNVGGWSAGLELRLVENTWLAAGFGTRFDALGNPAKAGVFAGIRWGIASESRLRGLRQEARTALTPE